MFLGSTLDEAYLCFPEDGLRISYYLTEREIISDGKRLRSYSLIIKERYRGNEQTAVYDDCTCCKKTAQKLFDILSSEAVTIVTAEDILFELIEENADCKPQSL